MPGPSFKVQAGVGANVDRGRSRSKRRSAMNRPYDWSMSSKPKTMESVRDEILSAIAEVRAVARSEHDEQRTNTADWLVGLFVDVTDVHSLREAAASALSLYGGAGSFSDVGTAESHHAVSQLADTLRRGRSWFLLT